DCSNRNICSKVLCVVNESRKIMLEMRTSVLGLLKVLSSFELRLSSFLSTSGFNPHTHTHTRTHTHIYIYIYIHTQHTHTHTHTHRLSLPHCFHPTSHLFGFFFFFFLTINL
ncbi:hypothetical protein LOAG_07102, partial [Loa loa]